MSYEVWGDNDDDYASVEQLLADGWRSGDDISQAMHDVIDERLRQQNEKGWTPEHDDTHSKGEMIRAALNYLAAACIATALGGKIYDGPPPLNNMGHAIGWPWKRRWWKPGLVRRMLVKVAALVVAEIERIDRAAERSKEAQKS